MNVVVIDDEVNSLELLNTLLSNYCKNVNKIELAESVDSAIPIIEKVNPDLIFLDIEMPEANGFQLLDRLSGHQFLTCFTTGYEEYAVKAIKYDAFGYLLKPIDLQELKAIVHKASTIINKQQDTDPTLVLSDSSSYHAVKHSEIIYIQGSGNYTSIQLQNGKTLLSQEKLRYFEDHLTDSGFFRVHRSYIVNISQINSIMESRTGVAIMSNNQEIPIANRRLKEFLQAFRGYF